ncbi:MAG: hypothetical protein NVSMB65_00050 [Chloroflexota bacterium]
MGSGHGVVLPSLSAEEVHQELVEHTDLLVLDVREDWEWETGHIAGAHHLPMNDVPAEWSRLDPARRTVVVCHMGQRSALVTQYLQAQGFTGAHNLEGGMDRWTRLGYEVE